MVGTGDLNSSLEGTPMTGVIYVDVSGKAKRFSTGASIKNIFDASLKDLHLYLSIATIVDCLATASLETVAFSYLISVRPGDWR
jgi:hypothetical protein